MTHAEILGWLAFWTGGTALFGGLLWRWSRYIPRWEQEKPRPELWPDEVQERRRTS